MKIVGFEQDQKLHLGVVQGDQVIDLQAVDPKIPTNLGEVLARTGGDLKDIADGVIVGSAVVKKLEAAAADRAKGLADVTQLVRELRGALG